jgi:hypothetical protein
MGTDVRDQHPAAAVKAAVRRNARRSCNLDAARLRREDALNQSLASLAESIAGLQVAQRLETWLPAACCRRRNSDSTRRSPPMRRDAPNLPWCSTPSANCAAPAPNWSRRAATSSVRLAEIEKDGGRRLMKTHYVTVAVAVMLAVGAGYWAGQRKGMHEGAQTVGAGNTANSTAAASGTAGEAGGQKPRKLHLLPQPDGPARHLAGAEEGFHGHGLHRCL